MTTTVILNPMNPWLCSRTVQERLLQYWEAKQNSESKQTSPSPLITVSIDVAQKTSNSSYEQLGIPATA
ncbi:hypothetical protein IQ235_08345 [Oscillatoriales cyanobacterium LEGE 11467]|uniref:Uncharacterized protein n=1 Tax=Zarconia navalis LEGE 11467 TaxID=1828826 RepID=A0A928VYT5_9CYAN|nr:hypothetical protein [Zarconia navalis]MBE9040786.1 hypothetical protein [Zarconia navalis LEGE 11467]